MEEINGYLKVSGRAIGHRVWQSNRKLYKKLSISFRKYKKEK